MIDSAGQNKMEEAGEEEDENVDKFRRRSHVSPNITKGGLITMMTD